MSAPEPAARSGTHGGLGRARSAHGVGRARLRRPSIRMTRAGAPADHPLSDGRGMTSRRDSAAAFGRWAAHAPRTGCRPRARVPRPASGDRHSTWTASHSAAAPAKTAPIGACRAFAVQRLQRGEEGRKSSLWVFLVGVGLDLARRRMSPKLSCSDLARKCGLDAAAGCSCTSERALGRGSRVAMASPPP